MRRGILRGLEHLAHERLADLVGLAEHPDRLVGRGVLALEDLFDEGVADRLRLPRHPDLLALVLAAEDLLRERAANLARLAEHPALLGLARGAGRRLGDGAGREEDRALGGGRHGRPEY